MIQKAIKVLRCRSSRANHKMMIKLISEIMKNRSLHVDIRILMLTPRQV